MVFGLFTGFAEPHFVNVRMGTAHLEGVMNGILLLALGAVWPHVRLGRNARVAAFWTALYSAYANWLFTTLAAIFCTGALSPIAAPGFRAQPWQERLVTAGLMSVGIVVVVSALIFLWGLRGKPPQP